MSAEVEVSCIDLKMEGGGLIKGLPLRNRAALIFPPKLNLCQASYGLFLLCCAPPDVLGTWSADNVSACAEWRKLTDAVTRSCTRDVKAPRWQVCVFLFEGRFCGMEKQFMRLSQDTRFVFARFKLEKERVTLNILKASPQCAREWGNVPEQRHTLFFASWNTLWVEKKKEKEKEEMTSDAPAFCIYGDCNEVKRSLSWRRC